MVNLSQSYRYCNKLFVKIKTMHPALGLMGHFLGSDQRANRLAPHYFFQNAFYP